MKFRILFTCIVCFGAATSYADPVGTAFTYQGQLAVSGAPANGNYDFIFALYNSSSSGSEVGNPLITNGLAVSNGLFNTTLDFGSQFNGTAFWLAISVRTNNTGNYVVLTPRQALTPTPNALFASGAANAATASSVVNGSITGAAIAAGAITSANIGSGQVVKSLNGIQDAVTLAQGNNVTITPSGHTLTIAATSGGANWSLIGNGGTTPGVNFVGTTDNQPLEFHVNGARALRLEPDVSGSGAPNVIGGSLNNIVDVGVVGAFIGGGGGAGFTNRIAANYCVIGGGVDNTIQTNTTGSIGSGSTIAGGWGNTIQTNCQVSTIAGGNANIIQTNSYGSSIGGGVQNTVASNSYYGTIPGGVGCVAGNFAFAAGVHAYATNQGAFVWADDEPFANFYSAAANEFAVRCTGGARFVSGVEYGTGTILSGVQLASGGGSWSSMSDRNAKDNFKAVDAKTLLSTIMEMPISTWNYKTQDKSIRHIGPMAQDFYAAFKVGEDDKHATEIDEGGVALAAIQGLNLKLEEDMKAKDAEIQKLREEVSQVNELKERLSTIERLLKSNRTQNHEN